MDTASRNIATADSAYSYGNSGTIALLDFESGETGNWTVGAGFSKEPLHMEVVPATKNNKSEKILHIWLSERNRSGAANYIFSNNGGAPVVLTPEINIAISWNSSRVIGTNGLWFGLWVRNTRNNNLIRAAIVNHLSTKHRVVKVYNDPPRRWCYHFHSVYEFIKSDYDLNFQQGDMMIEGFFLGFSNSAGVEAWVDNIWVGKGEPPSGIDRIRVDTNSRMAVESKITGFSYGYFNDDNIPDRVDVYPERAEIFINPHLREAGPRSSTVESGIEYIKKEADHEIRFDRQREGGAVSTPDLDGDGLSDFLFHFEDTKGNRCYRNDLSRRKIRDVTPLIGPLRCEGQQSPGSAAADIDADGDADVFMFNAFLRRSEMGGVRFLRNEGDFRFADWLESSGVISQGSFGGAFLDFNGDGAQDLFVNYRPLDRPERPLLYFNDGMGKFSPAVEALKAPPNLHFCGFAAADFDNDGDMDIFCVSDYFVSNYLSDDLAEDYHSALFRNDGSGVFTDITEGSGVSYRKKAADAVAGDFDQDGLVDIYIINSHGSCVFYHNQGGNRFVETERFTDLGCDVPVTAGTALDFDCDGDLDLVMLRKDNQGLVIRENEGSPDNFLSVNLWSEGANRRAVGGKVYIYEPGFEGDEKHLAGYREIGYGTGVEVYSPPAAHFGLGTLESVDVRVVFPSEGGRPAFTVTRKSVPKGSFLTISRYHSFAGRVFHNPAIERARYSFILSFFSLPAWLAAVAAVVLITACGIFFKDRIAAGRVSGWSLVFPVAGALAAALILFRAPLWGLGALVFSGSMILFSYDLEDLFRRAFSSRSSREKMEEMLLDDLSQAIHTEKKFAFLGDIARNAEAIKNLDRKEIVEDFNNLNRIISLMRISDARDEAWRKAAREVKKLEDITGKILQRKNLETVKAGPESADAHSSLFSSRLVSLNTMLAGYRAKLRRRYSVRFEQDWKKLKAEYRARLRELGVELEEGLPAEALKARVHLLEEEFRHIFKNLMDNSLWAVEGADDKIIEIEAYRQGGHLVVRWRDTGVGIPPEKRKDLFSSAVVSARPGGTGEGLYQSARILRRRGGLIRAEEPKDGKGTVFVVKLIAVSKGRD